MMPLRRVIQSSIWYHLHCKELGILKHSRAGFTSTYILGQHLHVPDQSQRCTPVLKLPHLSYSVMHSVHMKRKLYSQENLLRSCYSTLNVPLDDILKNDTLKQYLKHLQEKFEEAERTIMLKEDELDKHTLRTVHDTITKLGPLVYTFRECLEKMKELEEFDSMIEDLSGTGDEEMLSIAKLEKGVCKNELQSLQTRLLFHLLPDEKADDFDVILEVSAGVGGQEAMLFADEIFRMYEKFALYKGWDFEVVDTDENDIGGLRKASAVISGEDVYRTLKYEGGVHRVQRVPKTEKSGRIHTSTMTVAILPQPSEVDVIINPKDLRIDTYRASGAGGQHVNTTDSAVRLTHAPSGMVVECQVGRSQIKNREMALQILRSRLYEKEVQEQQRKQRSQRKLQVGSSARADKIRTYNYQQDRVTDHRLQDNRFNVDTFLSGSSMLDELTEDLHEEAQKERLEEILEDFAEEENKKLKAKKKQK